MGSTIINGYSFCSEPNPRPISFRPKFYVSIFWNPTHQLLLSSKTLPRINHRLHLRATPMRVAIWSAILITTKMTPQRQIIKLQWRWQNVIKGFWVTYLTTLERELKGCIIAIGDYRSSQRLYSIPYLSCLIIFFNKKTLNY